MASATYDELSRITSISDSEGGAFKMSYRYDKVGNRRSVFSRYWDLLGGVEYQQQFWYKYDAQNRFTTTLGTLDANNQIVRGQSGYDISYNALNQRVTQSTTDGSGNTILERYEYDANGFLIAMRLGSSNQVRAERGNNAVGGLERYKEYNAAGTMTSYHEYGYDADNNMTGDTDMINQRGIEYSLLADGRINWMKTFNSVDPNAPDVLNTYTYEAWDSYLQSTNKVEGIANSPIAYPWKDGESRLTYDTNGHVRRMYDNDEGRTIDYVNNQNGQTLKRFEYDGKITFSNEKPATVVRLFYYFNGRAVGDQGSDHVPSRVDYAQTLRTSELEGEGNKSYIRQKQKQLLPKALRDKVIDDHQHRDIGERVIPVTSADFDQNFLPINRDYPAHTSGSYTVQAGDTLQQIAAKLWGDSSLWYLIADANAFLSGNLAPVEYTRLTIPNVVTNIHNNAHTFRPFEPGLTLGNIQPTLPEMPPPPPPKDNSSCGFADLLVAIVAIVVTVVVSYYLGPVLGSKLMAAVIGAMAGSAVSQGVAMAMDRQDKFSWSGVAMAGVGAAVTMGLPVISGVTNPALQAGLQSMVASVVTQGIGVATGMQKKFSWTAVAAAGAGAAIGQYAGEFAGNYLGDAAGENTFIRNFSRAFANGATQTLMLDDQPNWGIIAAQSFAQGVGQTLSERSPQRPESVIDVAELEGQHSGYLQQLAEDIQAPTLNIEGEVPIDLRLKSGQVLRQLAKDVSVAALDMAIDRPIAPLSTSRPGAYAAYRAGSDMPDFSTSLDMSLPGDGPAVPRIKLPLSQQFGDFYDAFSPFERMPYNGNMMHDGVASLYNLTTTAANLPFVALGSIGSLTNWADESLGGGLTAIPFLAPEAKLLGSMAAMPGVVKASLRGMGTNSIQHEIVGPYLELGSREAIAAKRVYQESFNSKEALVIGRLDDTAAGAEMGMRRLNNPDWTVNVNDAWVQGGIDASKPYYLGSNISFKNLRSGDPIYPKTIFFRELNQLRDAGYYRQGDWMFPPKQ